MRLVPQVCAACLLTFLVVATTSHAATDYSISEKLNEQTKPLAYEEKNFNEETTSDLNHESSRKFTFGKKKLFKNIKTKIEEEPSETNSQQEVLNRGHESPLIKNQIKDSSHGNISEEETLSTERPVLIKESFDTEVDSDNSEGGNVNKTSDQQKTTYDGLKVLRVIVSSKEQKKILKQLESNGDINTWMGNGSAIDVLVRKDNVFDLLKEKKFLYDIVIHDLQKAIEEENPPLAEDEWSELEGRKVDYGQWIEPAFLSPFHHWIMYDVPRHQDQINYNEKQFSELRKKKIKKKKKQKKKRGHRMTWQMYHRMSDIHGYLDYLTTTYPDMCSQQTIGYSVEKKPLKVLKISSGSSSRKAIWVDSGIHAREWISPATSTYAISQMVENGDGTHGVDWYFLPLVNPDGYEHSHTFDRLWRKNRSNPYKGPCAGTDLNRNFGYKWGGQGSSQLPCRETYAGPAPFSEPETHAIKKFITNTSTELGAYISLHSYGQYILYPWGYDRKVPPDYSDLHRVGRAMAQAMKKSGGQTYKVGSAAATLYPAAGGSDDWAKGSARIKYTYTIELRDTGRHGFVLPAQYIIPTAKEAYAALKILAEEVAQL